MILQDNPDVVHVAKETMDAISVLTAGAALLNYAPQMAALLSCVWLLIRIYEYFRRRGTGDDA